MNVHITYKVVKTPDIEKEINHQIEKLRKRLQLPRPAAPPPARPGPGITTGKDHR